MQNKTNFFIVGAAKSGTTSLFKYLPQHPEIFFPDNVKEPAFFAFKYLKFPMKRDHKSSMLTLKNWWGVQSIEAYDALYANTERRIKGDASIEYLAIPTCAKDIKAYNPDAKIFICLRDPIERAYSHYMQNVRDDFEKLDFYHAVSETVENERFDQNFAYRYWYKKMGMYHNQVKTYIDVFGRDKVMVILHDDLLNNENEVFKNICNFLEIEAFEFNTQSEFNLSGRVQNRLLFNLTNRENILKKILRIFISEQNRQKLAYKINRKNIIKEKMDNQSRNYLKSYFKEDIIQLEVLIQRDLSSWYL